MSYRPSRVGLGQAKTASGGKTGGDGRDYTAQDVAAVTGAAATGIASLIAAATGAPQPSTTTATPTETTPYVPVVESPGGDWYWPAFIGVGVLIVGGIGYMTFAAKKPRASVAPNRRRGSRRRSSRRPRRNGRMKRKTASGKSVVSPDSKLYTARAKMPKWNIQPTALQAPKLLKRRLPEWTKQDHLDAAAIHRKAQQRAQRKWQTLLNAAEKKYGTDGPLISAGLREHWPASVKEKIRSAAHRATAFGDAAHSHSKVARPRS